MTGLHEHGWWADGGLCDKRKVGERLLDRDGIPRVHTNADEGQAVRSELTQK